MIEWLISFGNGCHYITMAFLLLYLLWLVRESFRTRKSGVVREEIMYSDDAGKCFLALWLAIEYLMRENFPFSLYPHYTAWKYWIAWPLLILCVIMEKSIKYRGFRMMIRRGISALFGKLDNARDFIERGSHGPQRWVILFLLVIFGQSFVSIPDIAASPDLSKSIEFFVVLAISILYSLYNFGKGNHGNEPPVSSGTHRKMFRKKRMQSRGCERRHNTDGAFDEQRRFLRQRFPTRKCFGIIVFFLCGLSLKYLLK
ncbi:hypothetical protein [Ruthenibacterium lactatiformans]|uniref:hypothetical protein n=1 Tax=Ruthenibacterium lactatiformans TaxID=1550024 RepID=UPI001967D697|nr:hypothetical protein [Ruthenibacterium lactatiformans]MBN3010480.1 hypothetical protein [Ruthenibacterium lactatiformans]